MSDTDDLKTRYHQQERDRNAETAHAAHAGKRLKPRRNLWVLGPIMALLLVSGGAAWSLVPRLQSAPACGPVAFKGYELTPQAVSMLKQCLPEQVFALAQEHRAKDIQQALLLLEHAAQANHAPAARTIAEMYDPATWSQETSPFSGPNGSMALRWYRKAEASGDTGVRDRIGALAKQTDHTDATR